MAVAVGVLSRINLIAKAQRSEKGNGTAVRPVRQGPPLYASMCLRSWLIIGLQESYKVLAWL